MKCKPWLVCIDDPHEMDELSGLDERIREHFALLEPIRFQDLLNIACSYLYIFFCLGPGETADEPRECMSLLYLRMNMECQT